MRKIVGLLAVLATVGGPLAVSAVPQSAWAQTHGMDRRDDRRDTRQGSRSVKNECKSNGNNRSDCRQAKRDVKQTGRHNGVQKDPK